MQMASRHVKRCLISLIIRDMQIKATIICHLIPVRMGLSKRLQKTRIGSYMEKENTLHCWWEYKLVQSLWKQYWGFLKNIVWFTNFSSRHIFKEWKSTNLKRYIHLCVHCSTIDNCHDISNLSVHQGWMDTEYVIYIHKIYTMEYYSTIKRKKYCYLQQSGWV